jgi:hypothetical protein
MEAQRLDRLTRALTVFSLANRRVLLWRSAAAIVTVASPVLAQHATAGHKKHKKHKKRKKLRCPAERRCAGGVCCAPSELCSGAACVIGQGICATGADSCEAGFPILCAENCLCLTTKEGDTRCAQGQISIGGCGSCTTSADCLKYGAAAFCGAAGPGCGCQAGEGVCGLPCFG